MKDTIMRIAREVKALSWARSPIQAAAGELRSDHDGFWGTAFSRHLKRSGPYEYLQGAQAEITGGRRPEAERVRGGRAEISHKDLMSAAEKTSRSFKTLSAEDKRIALSAFLITQTRPFLKQFDVEATGDYGEDYIHIPKTRIKTEIQGSRYSIDLSADDVQEALNAL